LREIQAYLRYEEAMELFDREDYPRAVKALTEVVASFRETQTRAGAMANLAMCHEFLHHWKDAADTYRELLADYSEQSENTAAVAFATEHLNWIISNRL